MSRTRPDLQYVVALMASRATKSPEVVNKIGQRLLDYLYQTLNYRLVFNGCEESELELSAYTDSSFAPAGARSHGAAVVVYRGSPICWRSSRQALVTLSTAESELVEAVEGALLLKSCEGTIAEIALQVSPGNWLLSLSLLDFHPGLPHTLFQALCLFQGFCLGFGLSQGLGPTPT